jgi:hypothetical protein
LMDTVRVVVDEEDMACTATPSNSFDTAFKKPKAPSSFGVWRTPGRRHIQTTECRCGALQRAVAPQPWPLPAHFLRGVQCRVYVTTCLFYTLSFCLVLYTVEYVYSIQKFIAPVNSF